MKQQSLKIFSKEETGPYELPKGWKWVRLGDKNIAKIIMGQSPPSTTYNQDRIGLPFYQGKTDFGDLYPSPRIWCSIPNKIAESGDILISVRAPVGPVNMCREKSCIGRGLAAIRPTNQIDNFFLFYYFKYIEGTWTGRGSTFGAIKKRELENLQIPLPSLPEQKRIVARIEALFSKIDEIKRLRKEANDLAKTLLQSALHEVFSKADEKGWRWVRLGSICLVRGGKRLPKGDKFSAVPTPFRYIRVSDFEDMSINVNTVQYVTKDVRNKIKDYIITKEDVYLSIAGTIGKAGTVPEELDKSNLTENAARLIIKNKGILDKTYLAFCLNSPYVQKIIENFTKIVGQPKLALFRIKEIQIPLAPLPEQKRIVAYLDQISEKQKTLLKIYADIDNQITELKQSILTKAFRGELNE